MAGSSTDSRSAARSSPKRDVRRGGRRTPGRVPSAFWSSRHRSRAMRVKLAGAGSLEGLHVAECFGRLLERLPGVIDPSNYKKRVDQPVTVDDFRALLRSRKYDIVHFAGHGR